MTKVVDRGITTKSSGHASVPLILAVIGPNFGGAKMTKFLAWISLLAMPATAYCGDSTASLAVFDNGQKKSLPSANDTQLRTDVDEFVRSCNLRYEDHPDSKKPITLEDWNKFKTSSYIHVRYAEPTEIRMVAGSVKLNEVKIGLTSYNVLGKNGDKVSAFHKCSGYHWIELMKNTGVASPITNSSSGEGAAKE